MINVIGDFESEKFDEIPSRANSRFPSSNFDDDCRPTTILYYLVVFLLLVIIVI